MDYDEREFLEIYPGDRVASKIEKYYKSQLKELLSANKYNMSKVDKKESQADRVLSGVDIRTHPNLILANGRVSYLTHQIRACFEYEKAVDVLTELDREFRDMDVVLNSKGTFDFFAKIVYRGGKLDDILRAMILFDKFDQENVHKVVHFFDTHLPRVGYSYWVEDDQDKPWKCVKFYLYSTQKTLFGKISPIEVQMLDNSVFVALKCSMDHFDYELRRIAKIGKNIAQYKAEGREELLQKFENHLISSYGFSADKINMYGAPGNFEDAGTGKAVAVSRSKMINFEVFDGDASLLYTANGNIFLKGYVYVWSQESFPLGGHFSAVIEEFDVGYTLGIGPDRQKFCGEGTETITFFPMDGHGSWVRGEMFNKQYDLRDNLMRKYGKMNKTVLEFKGKHVKWIVNGKLIYQMNLPTHWSQIKFMISQWDPLKEPTYVHKFSVI